MAKVLESNTKVDSTPLMASVFDRGNLRVKSFISESSWVPSRSKSVFIVTPTEEGTYPLLLFLHGFKIESTGYSQLLEHIASHGFVIVAPQLYTGFFTKFEQEVSDAAAVTQWMATELQRKLPQLVKINLDKLGLVGHSRGGKTAFALALGKAETKTPFSALMGIDPVAGVNTRIRSKPHILNYIPRSFDFQIPVGVIGTGLGSLAKHRLLPPCAPEGVNHAEFFNECKPPCCYFLAKDYGHMSMLDDEVEKRMACLCKTGSHPRWLMRKGVGGIVVAFMNAYLKDDESHLLSITSDPKAAPITLDPVIYIPA